MSKQLTKDELVFVQRMLPHFIAGKSALDAAEAVLEDDARLIAAFFDRQHSVYFPTADERGVSALTRLGTGDVIFSHIAKAVYQRLSHPSGGDRHGE